MKHKRSISIPNVGINASFFEDFERKLNLSSGNLIKAGKFATSYSNAIIIKPYTATGYTTSQLLVIYTELQ